MFMIALPLCAYSIHMRRDANADIDDGMDACNSCKMHPIMYSRSIKIRVHPLQATGRQLVVEELHWHRERQQGGFHPSFSQKGS